MTQSPFPRDTTFTPVPDPLLGPALGSIDNLDDLKGILRALWHLHRKKGALRYVTAVELASDPVLQVSLGEEAIQRAMDQGARLGVLARGVAAGGSRTTEVYVLNTEADRRALAAATAAGGLETADGPSFVSETPGPKSNIYALYEENIGMITPMVAEELKDAEDQYPQEWIEEALKEAVGHNKRSWRYVAAILKNWESQGKRERDGESRRDTQASDRKRYLKEYVRRRGDLPGS